MEEDEEVHQSIENPRLQLSFSTFSTDKNFVLKAE